MSSHKSLIEAAFFAAGRPLSLAELAQICESGNTGAIRANVEELQKDYQQRKAGLEIVQVGEGYMLKVVDAFEEQVLPLVPETEMPHAVLKTLALIAYEQPIKQSDVVAVRGSHAYKHIKRLRQTEYITAPKEGNTRILSTTPKFKEYFKIENLKDMV